MKDKRALLVVLVLSTLAFVVHDNRQFEISKNLEIFANVYKELNAGYVDDIDPSRIMRVGIEAMLETLDPFTNYISESDIESYRYMAEGRYDGIGASVRKMGDYVTVVEIFEGGPALESGLRIGDMILAVEGKDMRGRKTDEVNDLLRGYPGTSVSITIRRPGESADRDVSVKRDEVTVKNVPHFEMLQDGIAYVALSTFSAQAGRNVADAISTLQNEHPKLNGLIFDLRDNGGGYLREAISVSNLFIPKDEVVVTTKGKIRERDRVYKTTEQPLIPDLPVVVLTNRFSASASEIVSGVVQDLDRGVILGDKTYGKGLVQNTVDLEYNAKLKLTTSRYYIPSGRCIQSVLYEDGEPIDVPMEQRAAFKTRGGRKVYDGGGVIPDVLTTDKNLGSVLKYLTDNDLIFHYATKYRQENAEIVAPTEFVFHDFDDFIAFVNQKGVEFRTGTEQKLEELEQLAHGEGLFDLVDSHLKEIRSKIRKDITNDLKANQDEITALLEREIVSRYFYHSGRVKKSLRNDTDIKLAVDILSQPETYQGYLRNR